MIPIRDSAAPRRLTPVNTALIAANTAVFIYEISLGARITPFVAEYAMIPAHLNASLMVLQPQRHAAGAAIPAAASLWPPVTVVTSMFVHGGLAHLAGNMLYLFIFGAAVEARMGARRYLYFYFASGIAAAIATVWIAPTSGVPVIGASGAIAGVLGAYFILFPRGRILTVLPLFVFLYFFELPAVLYLLLWFAVQLYYGLAENARGALIGGVAWWAHVGGFLFGVALAPMIAGSTRRHLR